jgi:hypothetical protein
MATTITNVLYKHHTKLTILATKFHSMDVSEGKRYILMQVGSNMMAIQIVNILYTNNKKLTILSTKVHIILLKTLKI